MNKFTYKYRIYYEYKGPSTEDPFATQPLSHEEVHRNLEKLCTGLPSHFTPQFKDSSLCLTAVTSKTETETTNELAQIVRKLNLSTPGLSLHGEKEVAPVSWTMLPLP